MSMNKKIHFNQIALSLLTIGFVIWAGLFIYRSSFIAIDGQRYFSLFDDAMISMRYAWNLSHGEGLVWNPGEYVEGYTNLLMVLLMSLSAFIFDNKRFAVLAIQVAGILFMLGNAYLTMRIGHNKYDLTYSIKAKKPTYVQTFEWGQFFWGSQDISAWGKEAYTEVSFEGLSLFFIKDSDAVLWEQTSDSQE